ncbi:MAG: 30S ribosome-binding factor RbfA [Salinisphaera sp.]|nr:30S ribosome-binding factor RbfA [Salinisphaera sp.]
MGREFKRRDRVAEELKRELGILITTHVKDPRVHLAAITGVEVSTDLKYAKVHVGTFDVTAGVEKPGEVIAGLTAARGYLKRELGRRLRLRVMPELTFLEDPTEREAQRMSQLIDDAVDADRRHTPDAASSDGTS